MTESGELKMAARRYRAAWSLAVSAPGTIVRLPTSGRWALMTAALPRLVLGPLLRYVGDDEATVGVETDRACTMEVLGCSSPTFCVAGHHYGFVCVSGLESGACVPYEVHLDGERC
jgi:hypothetical protein